MGLHHHHNHEWEHDEGHHYDTGNLKYAFWLNTFFALIEIVGGLLTNSVAILSDALHDFGDSVSLGVSYFLQKKANKGRDEKYTFGYGRFSVLGALVTSSILVVGSVFIINEAIQRIIHPEEVKVKGMVLFALFGVLVNGLAYLRLKKGKTLNERAVSLHFIEDILGWVAVLIGSIVMYFVEVPVLDAIMSLGIAAYILFNVFRNLKSTLTIFLQRVPPGITEEKIRGQLKDVAGIHNIHDVHIWSLDGSFHILSIHLVLDNGLSIEKAEGIKRQVRQRLNELKIDHITVETEPLDMDCGYEDC